MRGITCIRGRGEKCGEKLEAEDDETLLEAYQAHVGERHADLGLSPSDVEGDVFITAYDVPAADGR